MSKLHKITISFLTLIALSAISHAGKFRTVVIDPGHGAKDFGGSYGKVYEKHLALDTSLRVDYLLRQRGYSTRLTRQSDIFIPLSKRSDIGNRYSNSIFVSIHYNYSYNKSASGIETFYCGSRSKPLASYIQAGMLRKQRVVDRGAKFARYSVLRKSVNPAALVECGFVSNAAERRRTMKGSYRQRLAEGIVDGIVKYQDQRSRGILR